MPRAHCVSPSLSLPYARAYPWSRFVKIHAIRRFLHVAVYGCLNNSACKLRPGWAFASLKPDRLAEIAENVAVGRNPSAQRPRKKGEVNCFTQNRSRLKEVVSFLPHPFSHCLFGFEYPFAQFTVYIGNLPYDHVEADIAEFFKPFGEVCARGFVPMCLAVCAMPPLACAKVPCTNRSI